jgi:transposase
MQEYTTFVGLDAHKDAHHVAMLSATDESVQEWKVPNTARDVGRMVRRVLGRAPGDVLFSYEAGVCGFALQRQIEASGARCQVIAPSRVPVRPGQGVGTDRRDARRLAEMSRAGLLTEVHPPTEAEESARDLVRCRQGAMVDLGRIRHRLSKFLLRHGLVYHEGRQWTQKHLRWVRTLRLGDAVRQEVFEDYLAELCRRVDRLGRLDAAVEDLAGQSPYRVAVGWLRCFRGIDTLAAMTILTELHGFERFVSARQLMSYLGLTPSEDSSGLTRRQGGITKAGNGHVRRILMQVSWHQAKPPVISQALRQRRADQPGWAIALADEALVRLHRRYWRLVNHGKLPTQAATAVARELAGFIWAMLYLRDQAPLPGVGQDPAAIRTQRSNKVRRRGRARQESAAAALSDRKER